MMGREIEDRFDLSGSDLPEQMEMEFYPRAIVPTISRNSPNKLVNRYWSLIPPYIKEVKELKFSTFNAKTETLREKNTYKQSWNEAKRCIFPATYFIEWKKIMDGDKVVAKVPYMIKVKGRPIFGIAGLYENEHETESATIITTTPNKEMSEIHHRSPVILSIEQEDLWLDKDTDLNIAFEMLEPPDDDSLEISELKR